MLRWFLIATSTAALLLGGWTVYRVAIGKTSPPVYTRMSCENAREAMRRARADRWAPDATRAAETAVRAAEAEYIRQQAAFLPVRNFDAARAAFASAEDVARQALRLASDEKERRRASSASAIDEAERVIAVTEAVAEAMHIAGYDQKLLRRSAIAVEEARLHHRNENFDAAEDRAELAALQASRVTDRATRLAARFSDPGALRQWKSWIAETIAYSGRTGAPAIVVSKEAHTLTLYDNGRPVKTWRVELGFNSIRDKMHAGDNATPEGRYRITAKKGLGNSRYHKALLLNYPNDEDRAQFARMKRAGTIPRHVSAGSLIEIHGEGGRGKDWTNGCVALTNREMDDLFNRVGVGTPVTIVGSDGNGGTYTELARTRGAVAAKAN